MNEAPMSENLVHSKAIAEFVELSIKTSPKIQIVTESMTKKKAWPTFVDKSRPKI